MWVLMRVAYGTLYQALRRCPFIQAELIRRKIMSLKASWSRTTLPRTLVRGRSLLSIRWLQYRKIHLRRANGGWDFTHSQTRPLKCKRQPPALRQTGQSHCKKTLDNLYGIKTSSNGESEPDIYVNEILRNWKGVTLISKMRPFPTRIRWRKFSLTIS